MGSRVTLVADNFKNACGLSHTNFSLVELITGFYTPDFLYQRRLQWAQLLATNALSNNSFIGHP
jgi:hypothetical protein